MQVRNKTVGSNNNNKRQYKNKTNQYAYQMKSFNRYKQALQTIKALDKSRPQSWAQARIKQARLGVAD